METVPEENNDGALSPELEQRIEKLERADEAAFGAFTGFDWLLLIGLCIVVPVIVAIAFR